MKTVFSKTKIGVAAVLLWACAPVSASDCFPPDVAKGVILEGRSINYKVMEVHKCWVKAVICPQPDNCRKTPYWVHVSFIEAYKARI